MKSKGLPLASVRLRNFKAIQDSGTLKFAPFTVLIGNNGSGKSSLIEGLETFQAIVGQGVDKAMAPWRKFEHVWNQAVGHKLHRDPDRSSYGTNPMSFHVKGRQGTSPFIAHMEVTTSEGGNRIVILSEQLDRPGRPYQKAVRDETGRIRGVLADDLVLDVPLGKSCLSHSAVWQDYGDTAFAQEWQFLSLQPQAMGTPSMQDRSVEHVRLLSDGSNIAQYLMEIRDLNLDTFHGILEAVQYVLPYATDLQPAITSELERAVYLQMTEGKFKVPGWLLSTGTLRILAILAVLRHPNPPPLVVIEEIENGLDPRTINLLIEEIKAANDEGIQVIATTHSPYLLDSVPLESVVLVERVDGEPKFTRPADSEEVQRWAKEFTTGRLYTMSRLSGGRA